MSYLIDTNVISELLKNKPNAGVREWFKNLPSESLFLSVLTLGEIRKGIEKLEHSKRKKNLIIWLEHTLPEWFGLRILSIDQAIADRWGYLMASSLKPMPAIDSLLAATALVNNLKMVTRNAKDFIFQGLEVINPFE